MDQACFVGLRCGLQSQSRSLDCCTGRTAPTRCQAAGQSASGNGLLDCCRGARNSCSCRAHCRLIGPHAGSSGRALPCKHPANRREQETTARPHLARAPLIVACLQGPAAVHSRLPGYLPGLLPAAPVWREDHQRRRPAVLGARYHGLVSRHGGCWACPRRACTRLCCHGLRVHARLACRRRPCTPGRMAASC